MSFSYPFDFLPQSILSMGSTLTTLKSVSADEALSQADISDLPEVLQQYLEQTNVTAKNPIKIVKLKQKGLFHVNGKKWTPLTAEQTFNTDRCEFVWKAKAGFMHVVDQFMAEKGLLRVKLFNLIKLVEATGPEIDQGEALRYLTEAMWFPTAFLSDRIRWESLNNHSVRGHIRYGENWAHADFHFNTDGEIERVTAKRYAKEKREYCLKDWVIDHLEYRTFHGIRIPYKAWVGWRKGEQVAYYYKFEITELEYS